MNYWWYENDGMASGPVSNNELSWLLLSCTLKQDVLVWSAGIEVWRPYNDLIEDFPNILEWYEERKDTEDGETSITPPQLPKNTTEKSSPIAHETTHIPQQQKQAVPLADYAGDNRYKKNINGSRCTKSCDVEVERCNEDRESNNREKASQIKLSLIVIFILLAVFLTIKNPALLIPVVASFAIIYFMFFYSQPSPSPSEHSTEVYTARNIIAYYLVMLFTVGGASGRHTVLGDIFLSFLAILLAALVGTISVLLVIFLMELFGLKYLTSKANEKIELLIPLVGYAFIFSLIYKDVVF
ncbi:GYF domain-containing protein [Aeromonas veronii]